MPEISVLMPVYNSEKYLGEAIESILNQTYEDFEFLMLYDKSTDKSPEIINSYNDSRIKIINCNSKGLVNALNIGVERAEGEFIARMDADDISLPERFQKQIDFLEKNPNVGICGSWTEEFGEVPSRIFKYPSEPDIVKAKLFFFCALAHPSVMMRKSFLEKYSLRYNETQKQAEDYELWQRCSFYFDIANLPEVLLKYRITSASKVQSNMNSMKEILKELDRRNLEAMGINPTTEELELHQAICPLRLPPMPNDDDFKSKAEQWLFKLDTANKTAKRYPEKTFSELIEERLTAVFRVK